MDRAKSTAKLSEASKNSSKPLYYQHKLGLQAEEAVVLKLQKRGYKILAQRLKTPFGEIDLLVKSLKGRWVLLEVKRLSRVDWIENRITDRQLRRLVNLRHYLESKFNVEVELWGAFVHKDRIQFLPL